jgi:hypothetical protein
MSRVGRGRGSAVLGWMRVMGREGHHVSESTWWMCPVSLDC